MLIDMIRREPVRFSDFADALITAGLLYAVSYGMRPDIAASITTALTIGMGWFVRAAVVPNVKLTTATIEKAARMTPEDIDKVKP